MPKRNTKKNNRPIKFRPVNQTTIFDNYHKMWKCRVCYNLNNEDE